MEDKGERLKVRVDGDEQPVVRLAGQADYHNMHQISDAFGKLIRDGRDIRADLSELDYIDSSGISVLIKCAVNAGERGSAIEIVGVGERVHRILTLCGAAALFKWEMLDTPAYPPKEPTPPDKGFWHVSSFTVPASAEATVMARGRVADLLRRLPLDLSESQDVLIAVGEALVNALKHGCGCDSGTSIRLKCVAHPHRLVVDVTDPGQGFDPEGIAAPTPECLVQGGMGIYIMRALMDDVSFIFHNGTTVRLVKYLNRASASDSQQSVESDSAAVTAPA